MAIGKMCVPIKVLVSAVTTNANGVPMQDFTTVTRTLAAVNHKLKSSYLSSSGCWENQTAITPLFQTVTFRRVPGVSVTVNHYVEMDGKRFRILGLREHHRMYIECMIATELNAKGGAYGES
ncbi:hypothetical protein FACS1894202_10700 [Clostridia bacterium]|nr:hypothetical protein FACS1894202_10700 [Clostridia bacterium]